jgi:hypothetical protein
MECLLKMSAVFLQITLAAEYMQVRKCASSDALKLEWCLINLVSVYDLTVSRMDELILILKVAEQ